MNTSIHPSPEELSAYFDDELSPQQGSNIEAHLNGCPGCKTLVDEFGLMAEMGPRGDESLPGPAYWQDLPDRILARIADDSLDGFVPVQSGRSFWNRLWNPEGPWRWAVGTAASAVLVAGAWFVLAKQPNPRAPVPEEIAQNAAWLCSDRASYVSGECMLVDYATICR